MIEDEEAATDVEDASMLESDAALETPSKTMKWSMDKSSNPGFLSASGDKDSEFSGTSPGGLSSEAVSPRESKRLTRAAHKSTTGVKLRNEGGRSSPFDLWKRTKDQTSELAGKRRADGVDHARTKRTRT